MSLCARVAMSAAVEVHDVFDAAHLIGQPRQLENIVHGWRVEPNTYQASQGFAPSA